MHWAHRHRLWIVAAICAFWMGVVISGHFLRDFPFISNVWRSEQGFQDLLCREGRKTPTQPNLVFIGIDQNSLEEQPFNEDQKESDHAVQLMIGHGFPWSRELWAILLDRLFSSGARLIMFDLVFSPPNEGDPAFREALERYRD